ncbi:hypothetical protein AB5J72_47550 [Streptomyces sp. CG1]|uniref:hypothetical protein n=1 Tax=Streptomyces sp. CG1 TaxID=1287523 RepID=UPI0034E2A616
MTALPLFDAAYSVGGVWYEVEDAAGTELCSHLMEESDDITALQNIAAAVRPGGPLVLAVQQAHRSYQRPLPGGLVYAQEIRTEDDRYVKDYYIRRAGEIVAHQRCLFHAYPQDRADQLFAQCGFHFEHTTGDGLLRRYTRG